MATRNFARAAVLGSGMMGPGIAVSFALGGLEAHIVSRTEAGAARGMEAASEQLRTLEEHGLIGPQDAGEAMARIKPSHELDAVVPEVDIVVESVPEDMALKQELFERLDRLAKPEAVLATNTSSLSINAVSSRCKRPERALTAHFWNPPYLMKLVELVRSDQTSDETLTDTKALLERCGKQVVVVNKDVPGQLGNRLQHAMVREAVHIVAEGIASAADVDLAAKAGFGLRLPVYGVLEHQDACGLGLVKAIQDYVNQDLAADQQAHPLMAQMVEEGRTGVNAGKGFYDWGEKSWDEVCETRDRFILHFLKSEFCRK